MLIGPGTEDSLAGGLVGETAAKEVIAEPALEGGVVERSHGAGAARGRSIGAVGFVEL